MLWPQGVPGALTNQPPTPGTAAAASGRGSKARRGCRAGPQPQQQPLLRLHRPRPAEPTAAPRPSTKNYEIDRTVCVHEDARGQLQRLTVAVLIDNLRSQPDKDGQVTRNLCRRSSSTTSPAREGRGRLQRGARRQRQRRQCAFMSEPAPAERSELETHAIWEQAGGARFRASLGAGIVILLVLVLFRPASADPQSSLPKLHGRAARGARGFRGCASCGTGDGLRAADRAGTHAGRPGSGPRGAGREDLGADE